MSSMTTFPSTTRPVTAHTSPVTAGNAAPSHVAGTSRVLRNTYALLSMTLLFSAAIAAASVAVQLPAPGLLLTLGGYFGLLFAVYKLKNSALALPAVFALTGFMGYSLGPVLAKALALPGGAQVVTMALAATGATFLALSAWALTTRRDFSFFGGFLFAGMVIALIAGVGAVFLQLPALGLAMATMVALLSAGLILFETSRIVNGGETNYVLATVGLYVSIFNLFTSLFGFGSPDECPPPGANHEMPNLQRHRTGHERPSGRLDRLLPEVPGCVAGSRRTGQADRALNIDGADPSPQSGCAVTTPVRGFRLQARPRLKGLSQEVLARRHLRLTRVIS